MWNWGLKLVQIKKTTSPTARCYCQKNQRKKQKRGKGLGKKKDKDRKKAKVVAAIWGKKCIQFLATLAILHQDDFEEQDELILFLNHLGAEQLARQGIE